MKTRTWIRNLTGGTVACTLVLGGQGVAHAVPSDHVDATGDRTAATSVPVVHDARDVVAFFLLGTGPLFDTHPELAESLGMHRQAVPDEVIDQVVADVLGVDPEFDTSVVEPIQSRDPVRVQHALQALDAIARQLLEVDHGGRADGRGWFYTTNAVATINVAAGVLVVAAAGVVVAAAIVLYVADRDSTRFDRELRALVVAEAL